MFKLSLLLTACLCCVSFQEAAEQPKAEPKPTKEVVFEVPGISCVGRFKTSLYRSVVGKLDGVHSVNFEYLDRDPSPAQQQVMIQLTAKDQLVIGGLGKLIFQVDQDFDPHQLVRRLIETRIYNVDRWVIVERTLLTDPKFKSSAGN